MCGIAGFISPHLDEGEARDFLRQMTDSLKHRGPDDEGHFHDPRSGVALGFRRLAILDLSETGKQPMASASGRYSIVFNGEIYNFRALRRELEGRGCDFRGSSDTEVLLAAIEEWGLEPSLQRCNGMFAFALWDAAEHRLHLARDRVGKKPLYYGWQGRSFLYASEFKALRQHPDFGAQIDRDAVNAYLRLSYVPAPLSIYRGIAKLPPGTTVTISPGAVGDNGEPKSYWSLSEVVERPGHPGFGGSLEEAVDVLDGLLQDSTSIRMESDVPLGAFLSGGIDSSLVVAMMQSARTTNAKTFTIGFKEEEFSEARHAAAVAKHLGTDHSELYVTSDDALDLVPRLPQMFDEPFADSSQIPTHLVSLLAARDVTVVLSGDGGDEFFGGYTRYLWARGLESSLYRIPRAARRRMATAIQARPPEGWDRRLTAIQNLLPPRLRQDRPGEKLHKLAEVLDHPTPLDLYLGLLSHWKDPEEVESAPANQWRLPPLPNGLERRPLVEQMMYLDSVTYLPDDILVKLDRATMAASLEARAPLLDYRVMEFAWSLPVAWRTSRFKGKRLLRAVLGRHVPEDLFDRPKTGFGIPLGEWIRGPLREWAAALLDPALLREHGFLDAEPIQQIWQEHVAGHRDRGYQLWNVLMFQAWLEANR